MIMVLKSLLILSYLLMIIMNVLANTLPLGGRNTGEISASYPTLFTPAGFTFSIWGLIYLVLGFSVFNLVIKETTDFDALHISISVLIIISSLLNIGWLFAWHHDRILLSSVVMILLFLTLMAAYILSARLVPLYQGMIGLYFGWISVALIANIAITFVAYDIVPLNLSEVLWFIMIIITGVVIASITILFSTNIIYSLVFVWAYVGIFMRYYDSSNIIRTEALILMSSAILVLSAITIYQFIINQFFFIARG